jgi:hypothetical protein
MSDSQLTGQQVVQQTLVLNIGLHYQRAELRVVKLGIIFVRNLQLQQIKTPLSLSGG